MSNQQYEFESICIGSDDIFYICKGKKIIKFIEVDTREEALIEFNKFNRKEKLKRIL